MTGTPYYGPHVAQPGAKDGGFLPVALGCAADDNVVPQSPIGTLGVASVLATRRPNAARAGVALNRWPCCARSRGSSGGSAETTRYFAPTSSAIQILAVAHSQEGDQAPCLSCRAAEAIARKRPGWSELCLFQSRSMPHCMAPSMTARKRGTSSCPHLRPSAPVGFNVHAGSAYGLAGTSAIL